MDSTAALLDKVRARRWFYEFDLPDGTRTRAEVPAGVEKIHATRQLMIDAVLDQTVGPHAAGLTAVDLACHQGWFSINLARRGFSEVLAVDGRESHLEDTRLMAELLGAATLRTRRLDLEEARVDDIGVHDVTLMLGLLYHLENPVRALRLARAATRRLCIIETQVVPHVAGKVEWGSTLFQRDLKGIFGVLDETGETEGTETGMHGICLAPSIVTLAWLLERVGFSSVVRVHPPADGYEQLVRGRRAMFVASVESGGVR
jgi:tRNA (mo5U34)-methyltransferase